MGVFIPVLKKVNSDNKDVVIGYVNSSLLAQCGHLLRRGVGGEICISGHQLCVSDVDEKGAADDGRGICVGARVCVCVFHYFQH